MIQQRMLIQFYTQLEALVIAACVCPTDPVRKTQIIEPLVLEMYA